jgi:hypothetical protein
MNRDTAERFLQSMLSLESEYERGDYQIGFNMGLAGEVPDETRSNAWLRGWEEAQETFIPRPMQIPSKPN